MARACLLRVVLTGSAVAAAMALAVRAQAAPSSHLWAWGNGDGGQLGIGTPGVRITPVPVHGLGTSPVRQVVAPNFFGPVVALTADGTVWAWGPGPLGNGSPSSTGSDSPVQLTSLPGTVAIAATTQGNDAALYNTFYALRSDGTVWAWGNGATGEVGDGSFTDSLTPVQVSGLTGVTAITAGGDTVYALRSDGTVWAWGSGTSGQLGNGSTANSAVPVQVKLADRAAQLASECGSGYALTGGRRIFAWGDNTYGQLGDGTRVSAATPVLVRRVSGASTVVANCVDAYAVIRGTGTVMAWGRGDQGEMGDGHTATRSLPVMVTGLSDVTQLSVGRLSAYAVLGDGTARAWGYGLQGQLGNGEDANSSVPVQVTGITSPIASVISGQNTIVARGTDGSLWSWGDSGFGANGSGGSGGNPGRVPRAPAAQAVYDLEGGTWFAAV
jgi:alpha-tubulin suppressor-like RCC1 family protein